MTNKIVIVDVNKKNGKESAINLILSLGSKIYEN
jgi:hypothetical protein